MMKESFLRLGPLSSPSLFCFGDFGGLSAFGLSVFGFLPKVGMWNPPVLSLGVPGVLTSAADDEDEDPPFGFSSAEDDEEEDEDLEPVGLATTTGATTLGLSPSAEDDEDEEDESLAATGATTGATTAGLVSLESDEEELELEDFSAGLATTAATAGLTSTLGSLGAEGFLVDGFLVPEEGFLEDGFLVGFGLVAAAFGDFGVLSPSAEDDEDEDEECFPATLTLTVGTTLSPLDLDDEDGFLVPEDGFLVVLDDFFPDLDRLAVLVLSVDGFLSTFSADLTSGTLTGAAAAATFGLSLSSEDDDEEEESEKLTTAASSSLITPLDLLSFLVELLLRSPPNFGRGDFFFSGSSSLEDGLLFGESNVGTLSVDGFLDGVRLVDLVFSVDLDRVDFSLSWDLDRVDFFFSRTGLAGAFLAPFPWLEDDEEEEDESFCVGSFLDEVDLA